MQKHLAPQGEVHPMVPVRGPSVRAAGPNSEQDNGTGSGMPADWRQHVSEAWEGGAPRRRRALPIVAGLALATLVGVLARGASTSTPELAVEPGASDAAQVSDPPVL